MKLNYKKLIKDLTLLINIWFLLLLLSKKINKAPPKSKLSSD